ncbi:MAG TPA: YceI family protein [Gemmatimonadaceae bacterium]|nr:YceI family protein [Gemmatimonadaceae bacterium]
MEGSVKVNGTAKRIAVLASIGAAGAAIFALAPARESAQAAVVGAAHANASSHAAAPALAAMLKSGRYTVAPEGNEARYFAREQLAGVSFPNDAIGVTKGVSGAIVIDEAGKLVPAESKIVVDVTQLKSDRDRRDGYIQRRTLETAKYPTVTLVPKEITGLSSPLPDSGRATFQLVGDLTIKGVTRPTNWQVSARFRGDTVSGTASTSFTFADFQMEKPSVPIVLGVQDTLHLQYDFRMVPGGR